MAHERVVPLLRDAAGQSVRIPPDFELPGDDVVVWRDGARLVMEPRRRDGLLDLLSRWESIPDDIAPMPDRPPEAVEL